MCTLLPAALLISAAFLITVSKILTRLPKVTRCSSRFLFRRVFDDTMVPETIVIGGGVGGLAFASHNPRCLVLEANEVVGGGLHTFTKKGVTYPSGCHSVGKDVLKGLRYVLGRKHGIQLTAMRGDDVVGLLKHEGDNPQTIASGVQGLEIHLLTYVRFQQARRYLHAVSGAARMCFRVCFAINAIPWLSCNTRRKVREFLMPKFFSFSLSDMLSGMGFTQHEQRVINMRKGYWGYPASKTSFAIPAAIEMHYIHGHYHFTNGNDEVTSKLVQRCIDRGGQVVACAKVSEILVDRDGHVEGVRAVVNKVDRVIKCRRVVNATGMPIDHMLPSKYRITPLETNNSDSFHFRFGEIAQPMAGQTWNGADCFTASYSKDDRYAGVAIGPDADKLVLGHATNRFTANPATCLKYLGRESAYGIAPSANRFDDERCLPFHSRVDGLFNVGQQGLLPGVSGALASVELTEWAIVLAGWRSWWNQQVEMFFLRF